MCTGAHNFADSSLWFALFWGVIMRQQTTVRHMEESHYTNLMGRK